MLKLTQRERETNTRNAIEKKNQVTNSDKTMHGKN